MAKTEMIRWCVSLVPIDNNYPFIAWSRTVVQSVHPLLSLLLLRAYPIKIPPKLYYIYRCVIQCFKWMVSHWSGVVGGWSCLRVIHIIRLLNKNNEQILFQTCIKSYTLNIYIIVCFLIAFIHTYNEII